MLADDQVDIWAAVLDPPKPELEELSQALSPDEMARAGRFYFERHRRRFFVARGVLRRLLGTYLEMPPERVPLTYGPYGKPAVQGLRFNLAHSNELAVYAFCRNRELGVDVEWMRPLIDAPAIAQRFFSAQENAALNSLPQTERLAAFFRCWTRKEAYLKALGDGLARPLTAFDVEVAPDRPPRLLRVEDSVSELERWSFHELPVLEGYSAMLVIEGHGARVRELQWAVR